MRDGMVKVEGGQVGMLAVEPRMMDEVAMRDKAGRKSYEIERRNLANKLHLAESVRAVCS